VNTLHIDVVSDVVCPWCFIGKRHLDVALKGWLTDHPDHPVTVTWRPYFLNPDTPIEGEPYRPFLEHKFGSAREVDDLLARVSAAGERSGVQFAFEKIKLRAHTLRAHRLIHYAQKVGAASSGRFRPDGLPAGGTAINTLIEQLFAANFQRGENIGDLEVLSAIAQQAGLDASPVRHYLESDADAEIVRSAADQAKRNGINGVPYFLFNQRLAATGAQAPEQLRQAMEQASIIEKDER
jgi:predicted DsbA family dithiol-disulfide isomerase